MERFRAILEDEVIFNRVKKFAVADGVVIAVVVFICPGVASHQPL